MTLTNIPAQDKSLIEEIVNAIGDATAAFDRSDRLIAANQVFLDLWGFSSDMAVNGVRFSNLWQSPLVRCDRISVPETLEARTCDGQIRDVRVIPRRVREADILPHYRFFNFRNISDQEELINALVSSEQKVSAIMDNAAVGLATVDENGALQSFNKQAEVIFGYQADELMGQNLTMLMPVEERAKNAADFVRLIETGHCDLIGDGPQERKGVRRDGSIFPMEIALADVSIDGRRTIIGSFLDITEKKLAEQQLRQAQKMEAVGQLTGGIAHDFNNLLSSLSLNLAMVQDEEGLSDDIKAFIDAVGATVERGSSLSRRLLCFSRRQAESATPLVANGPINDVANIMTRTFPGGIQVKTRLSSDLWHTKVDGHQLENAVLNLCINARDAMPDGGTLAVESHNLSLDDLGANRYDNIAPGDYVQLQIKDSGCGMPRSMVDQVTDPFFTTKEDGSGLGLSMVHGFIRQAGGHLKITSAEGIGTTVEMLFPRIYHEDQAAPVKKSAVG